MLGLKAGHLLVLAHALCKDGQRRCAVHVPGHDLLGSHASGRSPAVSAGCYKSCHRGQRHHKFQPLLSHMSARPAKVKRTSEATLEGWLRESTRDAAVWR